MDQEGNQCALEGGYTPCAMEMSGQIPDWDSCTFFNSQEIREDVEQFKRVCKITPGEFWPPGKKSWEGISFGDWWNYVTGDSVPRP